MKLFLTRAESCCAAPMHLHARRLALGFRSVVASRRLPFSAESLSAAPQPGSSHASQQPPVLYLTVAATSGSPLYGVCVPRTLPVTPRFPQGGADGVWIACATTSRRVGCGPGTKLSTLRRGDLMTFAREPTLMRSATLSSRLSCQLLSRDRRRGYGRCHHDHLSGGRHHLAICLVVSGRHRPVLIARSVRLAESQGADARTDIAATSLAILEGATELSMRHGGRAGAPRRSLSESGAALSTALARSARLSAFSAASTYARWALR